MAYWILESPVGAGNVSAEFLPYNDFLNSWLSGSQFPDAPPNPIKLYWDPENESEIRKAYYPSGPVLMRKDLVNALHEIAIDNLIIYPVEVRSTATEEICRDYQAINIIGALAVADMEESIVIDEGDGIIDVIFGSLVIDEEKAHGRMLFRLAESTIAVLVDDRVKKHLEGKGGFGLTFTDPADFCG